MTDETKNEAADQAADTDRDPEGELAGDQADSTDAQEVAIDVVVAQGEKDPEPAADSDQQ